MLKAVNLLIIILVLLSTYLIHELAKTNTTFFIYQTKYSAVSNQKMLLFSGCTPKRHKQDVVVTLGKVDAPVKIKNSITKSVIIKFRKRQVWPISFISI